MPSLRSLLLTATLLAGAGGVAVAEMGPTAYDRSSFPPSRAG
jgi:hypothetical protein